jgi:hypothetical protein
MVENWQPRINPRQEVQQIQAELFHLGGSACPRCRQFNVKVCKVFCLFPIKKYDLKLSVLCSKMNGLMIAELLD